MKLKLFKAKPQGRQPVAEAGRPKAAFSYYAGDNGRQPVIDNVKKRQRRERKHNFASRLRSAPTITALCVIALSVVYSTTLSSAPNIRFVDEGSLYRPTAEYKSGITKILSSSLWNGSKLTINTRKTQNSIAKQFPEVDAVNVVLPIVGRRPTVLLHVRKPVLILTTQTNAYVVDTSGVVVALSSQIISSERDKLLTVQDQSGLALQVGSQALTTSAVSFIMNIQAQLKDKKLEIARVVMPAIPNEVDIYIKNQNYYIKTDSLGDARIEIGDYLAAKQNGVEPSSYIDVRVEEKVFYK